MIRKDSYPILTPEEAVAFIQHGNTVAFSGFSPAGAANAQNTNTRKIAHSSSESLQVPPAARVSMMNWPKPTLSPGARPTRERPA